MRRKWLEIADVGECPCLLLQWYTEVLLWHWGIMLAIYFQLFQEESYLYNYYCCNSLVSLGLFQNKKKKIMFKKIKHMIPVQGMRQGQEKGHLHPSGDQRELLAGGHLNVKGRGVTTKKGWRTFWNNTYTKAWNTWHFLVTTGIGIAGLRCGGDSVVQRRIGRS